MCTEFSHYISQDQLSILKKAADAKFISIQANGSTDLGILKMSSFWCYPLKLIAMIGKKHNSGSSGNQASQCRRIVPVF